MKKDAVIDASGQYRYSLLREWDSNAHRVTFIMLNPSTADATIDDRTINRCINFASTWGYGSIEVVNLFGYRAKDSDEIKKSLNPIGKDNDKYILEAVNRSSIVVLAWGDHGTYLSRDLAVLRLLSAVKDIYCLGITSKGNPRHPLFVSSLTILELYKPLSNLS